jgi:hypothetical protein
MSHYVTQGTGRDSAVDTMAGSGRLCASRFLTSGHGSKTRKPATNVEAEIGGAVPPLPYALRYFLAPGDHDCSVLQYS